MFRLIKKLFYLAILLGIFYAALWGLSFRTFDVTYGISFNQNHAESLGHDWIETYEAMLEELQPEFIRIAAMWSDVEEEKGEYDFSRVDWMMDKAVEYDAKVTLVVGQKAPRWPECHVPVWNDYSTTESKDHLLAYVQATVDRYKDHPALELWQIENEPFIKFQFGECEGYNKEAIYEEIELVRAADSDHKILVTDSGELGLWNKAGHAGDYFGTTLYRIVASPKGTIFNYDWVPAGFYTFKAKVLGIDMDRLFVAELQAEPWFTNSSPLEASIEEQERTMNPDRMRQHIDYVRHIGTDRAYLWGVEWWYYMKEVRDDARYWDIAKEATIGADLDSES